MLGSERPRSKGRERKGQPLVQAPIRSTLSEVTHSLNTWLEIDLDAVEANVAAMQRLLDGVELIAVVKANAYGAGAAVLAPVMERAGVHRFAVVWPHEGYMLRQAGATVPILVLGHAFPADATQAVRSGLTLTCNSRELADAISQAAVHSGATARVHVKVDTGLHRFGNDLNEAVALAGYLRTLPGIEVEGLTTHMANADEADDSFTEEQHRLFRLAAERLPWIPYRHTANSATALRRGELARVSDVAAGEGVSYGLRWKAARPSRVALVPVGYADGWRRNLSGTGEVLLRGRRYPMVGTVCMDQFIVDVTEGPAFAEGDIATLIGSDGDDQLTAWDVAEGAGTIAWDVLSSLGGGLTRVYHRAGHVEQVAPPAW